MTNDSTPSGVAVFSRLLWMFLCPMALMVLTMTFVVKGGGWFTFADMAFMAFLAAMLLARCWEFRDGHPQTATGQPATPAHLRRFLAGGLVVGLLVWTIANYLGNEW